MIILIFYMYKTLVGYNLEEVQSLFKVFLLDIQVLFDNCARLLITHTAADVALFAQMRGRLAMLIHFCQLIIHLLRKISILTLKCVTKTFYFVSASYTHWKRITKCTQKATAWGGSSMHIYWVVPVNEQGHPVSCKLSKSLGLMLSQQAKNIGPTWAPNGYLYGSYMGSP